MSDRSESRSRPAVVAFRATWEERAGIYAAARAEDVSVAEFCLRAAVERAEHSVVQEDRP